LRMVSALRSRVRCLSSPGSKRAHLVLVSPKSRLTRLPESGRATSDTPAPARRTLWNLALFVGFAAARVLLLDWVAADVFRCALADETLASPCMFSTAITFFHSLNDRFPLSPLGVS
jgi:hypothetical protein